MSEDLRCTFCGTAVDDSEHFLAFGRSNICGVCVALANAAIAKKATKKPELVKVAK